VLVAELAEGRTDGFLFGNPGDRFVAGDWGTIDGIDTPGLFRPTNTTLLLPPHQHPRQRRQPIHLG
jgi:hypothetical protein